MPTRRQFLVAGIAGPLLAAGQEAATPKYDCIIQGGRVIDASQKIDRVADVAIASGKIAAIRPSIAAGPGSDVIDARGKLVTPGLVDIHAHLADPKLPPAALLADGVTSVVDGGSRGADNLDELVKIVQGAPNRARILLNISRGGLGGGKELFDLSQADPVAARKAIEQNRDWVIGIKARLSRSAAGENDLAALQLARKAADPLKVPIMVHVGNTATPLTGIVAMLRPGDVVTHMYASPHGILDENGRVFAQIREARRRGVLFDFGSGRTEHWTWDAAERALAQDFAPDTISSDITLAGRSDQVFNLPNVLSNFLTLGMPVEQVIARATANPARVFPAFRDRGSLRVGAPADIAVLEMSDGGFEFVDNYKNRRQGHRKLFTAAVLLAGKRIS